MAEFVDIKHPDLEESGTSSREAFEKVWKDKGFELADEEETSDETARTARRSTRRTQGQSDSAGDSESGD